MNEHILKRAMEPRTTNAAEGLRRRAWTVAEVEAMVAAGIIDEREHFELIGGDAVPLPFRGSRHELVRCDLNEHLQKVAPDGIGVACTSTLRLDEHTFLEPDFHAFRRSLAPGDVRGHDVLLAIEVSDTSLPYDRGRKIAVYAIYGIPEIWVIDAGRLVTRIHRALGAEGYREVFDADPHETLTCVRVPALAVSLAKLGLTPSSGD